MQTMTFDTKNILPNGYYPWPDEVSPHDRQITYEYEEICYNLAFLSQEAQIKYVRQAMGGVVSRMLPNADIPIEYVRPAIRWMIVISTLDDGYEHYHPDAYKETRDRLISVFRGRTPAAWENDIFHQCAIMRDEMLAIMPSFVMDRYINSMYEYCTYGVMEEQRFLHNKKIPSLDYFLQMRPETIAFKPFSYFSDTVVRFPLPEYIELHPIIKRLRHLAARLCAFHNDIHSLPKELPREMEKFNLVLLLQREYNLSLEDAAWKAKEIHDADMNEFVKLEEELPDFDGQHEKVKKYVLQLGTMVQGLHSWYYTHQQRYAADAGGYAGGFA